MQKAEKMHVIAHKFMPPQTLTVGSSASGVSTIPFRMQGPEQQYRIAGPLGAGGYVGIWSPAMISTQASTEYTVLVLRATIEPGAIKAVALKVSRVSLRVKRPILRHESRVYSPRAPRDPRSLWIRTTPSVSVDETPGPESRTAFGQSRSLSALTHVHNHGIVHRDIKPENVLVSLADPSKILLIDFGISRFFHTGPVPSQYNPVKENRHVVGPLHWAIINAHCGIDLAPRDDLESLAYVLLFLLRGDLPWRSGSISADLGNVSCTGTALGTNFPLEFGALLDCSRALRFDQMPEYDDLQVGFGRLAERSGCESHAPLDWAPSDGILPVMSPPAPTENFDFGACSEGKDAHEHLDVDALESFSNSYWEMDLGIWDDIQCNRDRDLTFPEEQAAILDSSPPTISQVFDKYPGRKGWF
ncbi:kinase-like domain-containing protein [Mycena albidolilacea]|uniref:non-specific serine/threonine protein kinase n=1 Tax=Mycena albidolilacea TaxID=1033008 RepID=A0AAD7ATV4_9AGAR|nr:kinase-like domain-containing protein [Mycena albidolilacea]